MTYTALTTGETDSNSPIDQALMDKIRVNLQDHEDRVAVLEDPNSRVFDHFARRIGYGGGTTDDIIVSSSTTADVFQLDFSDDLIFAVTNPGSGAACTWTQGAMNGTSDNHLVQLNHGQNSSEGLLLVKLAANWTNRSAPITFTTRLKQSDNTNSLRVGLLAWGTDPLGDAQAPPQGIWMNQNGTSWRFSAKDGSGTTNGSDFTRVTASNWFEVSILFEDDPSTRARCYVDSVLKETLTTNLPTTYTLYGFIYNQAGASDTLQVDRVLMSTAGVVADL